MDERNKDLPLIVSEIVIEMHEMKEGIQEMRDDMRGMKSAIEQMASLMLKQQQHTNHMFHSLMEENRKNTEFMVAAFREEAQATRQRLDDHEGRISTLETR
ncbi:hypothetical protein [Hymenobacter weizhouensis]|uniref:hypothetical protein n=1 Tax=Hymenobacter sp. YIM 151500-1 TaxID=2987689 RepID=UPI002226FAA1|nr:hypothetical protein [Hymenobacter sp. YIM 151500-1]UYZ61627.1 hypothetical protein OIS53_11490 [Hymenobacter sp. YIM 151500-1]